MGTIPSRTIKILKNRILNLSNPGQELNTNKIHRANYLKKKKNNNLRFNSKDSMENFEKIYNCFYGRCNLCLEEKIQIMLYIDPVNLLNQRCDFIARCRHRNKFRLFWKITE